MLRAGKFELSLKDFTGSTHLSRLMGPGAASHIVYDCYVAVVASIMSNGAAIPTCR